MKLIYKIKLKVLDIKLKLLKRQYNKLLEKYKNKYLGI